jgi:hypothetical protein
MIIFEPLTIDYVKQLTTGVEIFHRLNKAYYIVCGVDGDEFPIRHHSKITTAKVLHNHMIIRNVGYGMLDWRPDNYNHVIDCSSSDVFDVQLATNWLLKLNYNVMKL